MNRIFLHIGLGKCASSKLQKDIFPQIAKFIDYDYTGNENIAENENDIYNKTQLSYHMNCLLLDREVEKLKFKQNIIVSNEGLSSYRQPQYYEEFSQKNLDAFGEDAFVILIIRKPEDFLTSIYVQTCIHEKPIQSPKHFFLNQKKYSERLPNAKFLIENFDYNDLINYYKARFNNLCVIKYEKLGEMNWAKEIFDLKNEQVNLLKKLFMQDKLNSSLGLKSILFKKKLTKFLNLISLDYKSKKSNEIVIERQKKNYLENEYRKTLRFSFLKKFLINFNIFMNKPYIIDKIFGYKKFKINFNEIEGLNLDKLEKDYLTIPDFKIFKKF